LGLIRLEGTRKAFRNWDHLRHLKILKGGPQAIPEGKALYAEAIDPPSSFAVLSALHLPGSFPPTVQLQLFSRLFQIVNGTCNFMRLFGTGCVNAITAPFSTSILR
jgi:hypothetical protein